MHATEDDVSTEYVCSASDEEKNLSSEIFKTNELTASDELTDVTNPPTSIPSFVIRRVHRDFVGLETMCGEKRRAMIDFSYHLAEGNVDEAVTAIKSIQT